MRFLFLEQNHWGTIAGWLCAKKLSCERLRISSGKQTGQANQSWGEVANASFREQLSAELTQGMAQPISELLSVMAEKTNQNQSKTKKKKENSEVIGMQFSLLWGT